MDFAGSIERARGPLLASVRCARRLPERRPTSPARAGVSMARGQHGTTDQARRIRRLKKRLYELKSLLEVTRDITSAPDEESVLKLFLRSCISMVQAESAAVFRYESVTGRLRLIDERNLPDPRKRPTAVLSADEVGFLEGPEAREGIVLRSGLLTPQARDFAREQG